MNTMNKPTSDAVSTNRDIWNNLYDEGMFLAYPSEVMVRLYHRHCRAKLQRGARFVDHGAGSGNNTEFLVRRGFDVTATDISAAALQTLKKRFVYANLPSPNTLLIDLDIEPAAQLPAYDAILAWDCLCYNTSQNAKRDIKGLVSRLEPGGIMLLNMPTRDHDFATNATRQGSETYIYHGEDGAQVGAVMCVPRDVDQLAEWCEGLEVLETGNFGSRTGSSVKEFMYLVGQKSS